MGLNPTGISQVCNQYVHGFALPSKSDLAGAVVEVVPHSVGISAERGVVAPSQYTRVTLHRGRNSGTPLINSL